MTDNSLSHVDDSGRLRMVDVSSKAATRRSASASCRIPTNVDLTTLRGADGLELVHVARLAGITGAKRTWSLIPLCHPIGIDDVNVDVASTEAGVKVTASVTSVARTGVEMEALTAAVLCALSLLDRILEVDPGARICDVAVDAKRGGKSDWGRDVEPRD